MELRIELYHARSPLPEVCRACLYWKNPEALKAKPDITACLHIVSSAQGLGIRQRLCACVEENAKQAGVPAIETIARMNRANNPSGPIAFWQKNGYAILRCDEEFALVRKDILITDTGRRG